MDRNNEFRSRNNDFENRGFQNRYAPVKVGDELDVTIEAVGDKGDGITKVSGFVLFVPGAKEGDQLKVRVTKVLRKVGFAEIVGQSPKEEETEEQEEEKEPDTIPEGEDSENFGEESSEGSEETEESGSEEEMDVPPSSEDEEKN